MLGSVYVSKPSFWWYYLLTIKQTVIDTLQLISLNRGTSLVFSNSPLWLFETWYCGTIHSTLSYYLDSMSSMSGISYADVHSASSCYSYNTSSTSGISFGGIRSTISCFNPLEFLVANFGAGLFITVAGPETLSSLRFKLFKASSVWWLLLIFFLFEELDQRPWLRRWQTLQSENLSPRGFWLLLLLLRNSSIFVFSWKSIQRFFVLSSWILVFQILTKFSSSFSDVNLKTCALASCVLVRWSWVHWGCNIDVRIPRCKCSNKVSCQNSARPRCLTFQWRAGPMATCLPRRASFHTHHFSFASLDPAAFILIHSLFGVHQFLLKRSSL